jgi:hypothetical protein
VTDDDDDEDSGKRVCNCRLWLVLGGLGLEANCYCIYSLRWTCLLISNSMSKFRGTRWRTWLMHCATKRKVEGSIPDSVIGIFH